MDSARPGADAGLSSTYHPLSRALADRYRIERKLGEGGMATVFLAHDVKHDRRVALKVLKPELAAVLGAERFVVEIRTTAALQHPHILPLFDSGTADGFLYYVMPFIDGETLRSKLDRETQLGIDESVKIATAVADALDYAHRHGVIHRDIKPENILLHDGRPMVADFGIALAVSAAAGGRMTETGLSLGTPHYMSPEQATAEKEITGRSDIYSLASVLFEMLAGQPPHLGGSAQQIIMKIIAEPAQMVTRHRKSVPPNVAAALMKGLEKLPADRFESAAAFAAALANPTFATGRLTAPGAAATRQSRTRLAAVAVGGALVGAIVAGAALVMWRSGPSSIGQSAERTQVTYSGRATSPAISPDGRFVAYVETHCLDGASAGGCASLYVNEVGTTRPVEVIGGANRLTTPRWTHDGLSLVIGGALGAGRSGLFTVARLGGTPRRFADEPTAYDVHPSLDSVVMVVGNDSSARMRVISRESGLGPQDVEFPILPVDISWSRDARMFAISAYDDIAIVGRDGKTLSHKLGTGQRAYVRWSADGKSLLAFRWTPGEEDDLVSFPISVAGAVGEPRLLMSRVATLLRGRFDVARTGRIVIGSGAVFSDVWSFDFTGASVRRRRETQGTNWYGPPVITADGRTIYYLRSDAVGNSLYRITDGREAAVTAERQMVNSSLRLSRDEHTITFESFFDSNHVLMVHDIAAGSSRQVPRGADDMGWVLPGSDGIVWVGPYSREIWTTDTAGGSRRQVAKSIGGPQTEALVDDELFGGMYGSIWSLAPDGRSLVVMRVSRVDVILFRVPLRGGEPVEVKRFPRTQGFYGIAAWLADGTILVSVANPSDGTTSIVRLDPASGATSSFAVLPAACEAKGVSVATAARRAACIVRDQRADVILIDGIRP